MTVLTPQQQLLLETYQDLEAHLARSNADLDLACDHHDRAIKTLERAKEIRRRALDNLDRAVDHHDQAIEILERAHEIRRRALDLRIEAMRCCNAAGFSTHYHLKGRDDA
jgi:tetratricopeptide (TPR) repeat protein